MSEVDRVANTERWWLVAAEEQTPLAYWTEKDARLVAKVRDRRVLGEYVPAEQLRGAVEALEVALRYVERGSRVSEDEAITRLLKDALAAYRLVERDGKRL